MLRAALYCRMSRDRVGAGLGVQRQEEDCRALAEKQGWAVTALYTDNDVSAYSGKRRPGYQQLLEDIQAGAVDVVITWHTDRLHRSPVELEEYISACDQRSVPTHTVKAGPLDLATPSGKLVARQLGAVARYEVDHAIERQQRAKLQAATDGRWKGGRRPYGYEADGVTVRPAEAAVVRTCAEAILAGDSLRSLSAALNNRGITTSTGRQWAPSELRKMLLRARNAGLMEHQGQVIGAAKWPAVLDESQWRALTSVLTDPARRTSWSSGRRWLLSGVATCGVCGASVVCTLQQSTRNARPAYVCGAGKHVVRAAAAIDSFVSDVVVELLSRPDAADLLEPASSDESARRLRDADALRERLDGLALAYAGGHIDVRQLTAGTGMLRSELERIESQIAADSRGSVLAGVAPGVEGLDRRWAALGLDRRRAIVEASVTVVLHRAPKGRRRGWRPGESYFDRGSVEIKPKSAT